MKICHLTSVHPVYDTRIFIKEACSLASAGFSVSHIVPGADHTINGNVRIIGVQKVEGSRLKRMTSTVNAVYEKACEVDADIYHFHDPELIPTGLKLKKQGKKVIYDVHEDVPRQILNKTWLPPKFQKPISRMFERFENKAARKFDLIVAATPHIRDRFLSLGANAIDVNNFPILDELTIQSPWKEKENVVCYVGGISNIRGLQEITASMGEVRDVRLLLAGNFTSKLEKEQATQIDGWQHVEELGYLDRKGVKNVYRKSFAGLVTLHPRVNYIDALPVKMFEYMAAGIPVIASNFPLWKEIVEGSNCGICVNPLSPQEIAKAITFLKENPEKAEEMGINGRNAVQQKYNWEIESTKLITAYEKLMR